MRHTGWMALAIAATSGACSGDTLGEPTGSSNAGGSMSLLCEAGLTRECVGPGACEGGQKCLPNGTWADCDCGPSGSGGLAAVAQGGRASSGGYTIALGGTYIVSLGGYRSYGGYPPAVYGGYPSYGGFPPIVYGGAPSYGGYSPITSGGAPPSGFGGTPNLSGGTSGGGQDSGNLTVQASGYVLAPPWQGYAWTATVGTGSTVDPVNYADVDTATQLCASGSVAATSDYSGAALLGVNLNQGNVATAVGTWQPSGSGITIDVTNPGGSELRLQIQAARGETDPNMRWCVALTTFGSPVTIAWSSFNTKCWDATGTAYDGQKPLESLMLLVPGKSTTAVPFDLCLQGLALAP